MLGLLEKFTIAELAADAQHPSQSTDAKRPIQINGVLNSIKTENRHDEAYIPG